MMDWRFVDFTMVCCTWMGTVSGGNFVGVTFVSFAGLIILHIVFLTGDALLVGDFWTVF